MTPTTVGFPALVQEFFHRRLLAERGVSAHTIASYPDTFELLLRYARAQCCLPLTSVVVSEAENSFWTESGSAA